MSLKKVLKDVPLLAGLDDNELGSIEAVSTVMDLGEDETVFEQGSSERDVFILIDGRVKIEVELKKGMDRATVNTVKPGQPFGEFALVDGNPRSASAVTVKPSKILKLKKEDFEALLESNQHIGYVVMKNMATELCERIRKTTSELTSSLMWE